MVSNSAAGFAASLVWLRDNATGPAIVAGVEGTRSYGIAAWPGP